MPRDYSGQLLWLELDVQLSPFGLSQAVPMAKRPKASRLRTTN